jgi:hypothetical protein
MLPGKSFFKQKALVLGFELTKPQTAERYKNAETAYNTQHHSRHKINKKPAEVLNSSNASGAPGNDKGRAVKKRHTRNGWHPSAPETSGHRQYSSMTGEGPYPLALARKGAEPPAMEMLPLSKSTYHGTNLGLGPEEGTNTLTSSSPCKSLSPTVGSPSPS